MIPGFTDDGVLPPFINDNPTSSQNMSPYPVGIAEFVQHFSSTTERIAILNGLLDYRAALVATGITGFQWLGGSFLEEVEVWRSRPPADIDVVTVFHRPTTSISNADWIPILQGPQGHLFIDQALTKQIYKCDAYIIDMNEPVKSVVNSTRFWFGLFSHQRDTSLWKGMLSVELDTQQDISARSILLAKTQLLTRP